MLRKKRCPVCGLPFHLCDCLLKSKNFSFDEMQSDVFLSWLVASASHWRKLCQFLDHGGLRLCSPLEVPALPFRSVTYFTPVSACALRGTSGFVFLHKAVQLLQPRLLKDYPFPIELPWHLGKNQSAACFQNDRASSRPSHGRHP